MFKRTLTLFLVIAAPSFLGCQKTATDISKPAEFALISQDKDLATGKIQDDLTQAKEAAKIWRNNAEFFALVIKIPPKLTEEGLEKTFVFGSNDEPNNWWTSSISGENRLRAIVPKEDFLSGNLKPIDEKYWKTAYTEVLKTAEDAGGRDFRAQNPSTRLNLVLVQTEPNGWLWWQIEYLGGQNSLKILVSAFDGKIYNENGEPQ